MNSTDDGNPAGSIHSSAVLLPSALGAAEYLGADRVSGERLLRAIIAGFEVGPRVGLCMSGEHMVRIGWHAPGIFASFPAAVAAGVVLGLNSEQMFDALGIAGTQASGLMAAQFGSMVKRMQCAKGAQSGLYAALLAAEGFTGIENIFEEKYGGFCSTFSHGSDKVNLNALVDGLGQRWETMGIGIKIYACAGGNQSAVGAIQELVKDTNLKAADVTEITVGVTQGVVSHHGWSPYEPKSLTTAQMHLGFCVAMQLIEGEVFVEQMVEQNIARPDLVDLANRVKVVRSPEREQKGNDYRKGCDVEVRLKNGKVLKKTVDFRVGSDKRPLTSEQIATKFRRLAAKALPDSKIDELERTVGNLESARSVSPLISILGAQAHREARLARR